LRWLRRAKAVAAFARKKEKEKRKKEKKRESEDGIFRQKSWLQAYNLRPISFQI